MRAHLWFTIVAIVTVSLSAPEARAACDPTYAFVSDPGSGSVLAVDLTTGALAAVARGLNDPRGLDLDPQEKTLYVAEMGANRLLAVDLATGAVAPVGSGWNGPTDVDVDSTGTTALVTHYGALMVLDLATEATGAIGSPFPAPAGVAYEAGETGAFVSDRVLGGISRVALATGLRLMTVYDSEVHDGVAVEPTGRWVYYTAAGDLRAYDLVARVPATIATGFPWPNGVAVDPAGSTAYVVDTSAGTLVAVDLATRARRLVASGMIAPRGVALACDPAFVPAKSQGLIEPLLSPTTCMQGTHEFTDPCTGARVLLESARYNLDQFVCSEVVLSGPDIGVECPVIDVQSLAAGEPACEVEVLGLLVEGDAEAATSWWRTPCTRDYDMIRGVLPGLTQDATAVDLGDVQCLADDLPPGISAIVAGPIDREAPPLGGAFFYLVRARGTPYGETTYGRSSTGQVRKPSSGDCAL